MSVKFIEPNDTQKDFEDIKELECFKYNENYYIKFTNDVDAEYNAFAFIYGPVYVDQLEKVTPVKSELTVYKI
jgi:hypothetical protein